MRGEAEIRAVAAIYHRNYDWARAEAAKAHAAGHFSLERDCDQIAEQARERLCMLGWVLGERTTPSPWYG